MSDLVALLLPMLRSEEGTRLRLYDDANGSLIRPGYTCLGHPTIGVGRALDTNGITEEEAAYLLANDIQKVAAQLDERLPWWRSMTMARQVVLVGMAFQLGITGLTSFRTTLANMEGGNYDAASKGMLASLWAKQTPGRAKRMAAQMRAG
jgi:lysozyme